MNGVRNKEDIQHILSVLGAEGALDTLLCVRELEHATASEVAAEMGTHVATAVKRLTALHDIGLLDRRVRRGRTRSAQEYSLLSNSFGLDIDLNELAGAESAELGHGVYMLLLRDMARRFGRFSGRQEEEIVSHWGIGDIEGLGMAEAAAIINDVLEREAREYGELTVKSLAAASAEAVGIIDMEGLPSRFFGVVK